MIHIRQVFLTLPLWLAKASPALAETTCCTTYEEKTLARLGLSATTVCAPSPV